MAVIVVLGGGVCGLATAMVLARDGHEVRVLERDAGPVPDSPTDAWQGWHRPGVAQFGQAHYLQARSTRVLDAELPDVRDALLAAGALRYDLLDNAPPTAGVLDRRPNDDRFVSVTARRSTLEQVVARAAAEEPRVEVERGVEVDGLVTRALDGVPHVTGVHTSTGRQVDADLVVDATGRRSPVPAWLRAAGGRSPHEEATDSGFSYYTRFFRSRDGGGLPPLRGALHTAVGTFSVLTIPADLGTWSVTLVADSHDRPLKELRHEEVWAAVLAACPQQAHWTDGEPITGVLPMSGVLDRYTRAVVDGAPVVTGLVSVSDAWACTNPSLGRGVSMGFLHATCLRDQLREGVDDDPRTFAQRWDDGVERTMTPWYQATLAVDRARLAEMRALRDGQVPEPPQGRAALGPALRQAAPHDLELFRAMLEIVGCLALPAEVFSRPGLAERVMRTAAEHPSPGAPGPDRGQLLALLAGVPVR
ncbi:FAD-dependent oxidoreductase [Modestobacter versicolor]|uniref:FAD-dependent oxidoreductase n=1 Tax=Modestobacter versicolor TaxID=429133 RepID=A0A323VCW3_9ACTN|nr:FAD-dependent oxidoreductase [Modestobacter versicolor]MBB3676433.1 2-polyprenyl-6-methoxyphenol hydroxylase-like FAD-dependent oxidoreductase [Modestobacter versicolor]PZA22654.1 FAD-dependent oxidoreductase [Modestobacter versicolor]